MDDRKIPEFKTVEEMADFWLNHDSTQFDHGPEESVEYQPKRIILSVRLDPEDAIALSREARRMGLDRSTLVRMIVRAHLKSGKESATLRT